MLGLEVGVNAFTGGFEPDRPCELLLPRPFLNGLLDRGVLEPLRRGLDDLRGCGEPDFLRCGDLLLMVPFSACRCAWRFSRWPELTDLPKLGRRRENDTDLPLESLLALLCLDLLLPPERSR